MTSTSLASPKLHLQPITNTERALPNAAQASQDNQQLILDALRDNWGNESIPYDQIETAVQLVQNALNTQLPDLTDALKNKYEQQPISQQALIEEIVQCQYQKTPPKEISQAYILPSIARKKLEIK